MTQEELLKQRGREVVVHSLPIAFEVTPGVPDNPEAPKASEGMEAFRMKVYAAIDARGWNSWINPAADHNFVITELYDSSAICQDTNDAKFYRIPITVGDDGEVSLGDPEEYDITYTPADSTSVPTDAPIAADGQTRIRTRSAPVRLEAVDGKPGVYRMLICNSGFAKKWVTINGKKLQMYISPDALVDAVAQGRFDGGRCFWRHPDANFEQDGKPKRERLLAGYIVPKSPEIVKNMAGGVDVWGHYDTIGTPDGLGIKAVIEKQAELRKVGLDITLIENSIFSEEPTWEVTQVEGVDVLKLAKLNRRVDVDFVDEGAVPRASVYGRIAANASPQTTKVSLTMDEKKLLLELQATVGSLKATVETLTASAAADKKRVDDLQLEKEIDVELSASGMKPEHQAASKTILKAIPDPTMRAAQLQVLKSTFLASTAATSKGGANGTDNGGGAKVEAKPLPASVQAAIDKAAAAAGVKPETLAKAQLDVCGVAN